MFSISLRISSWLLDIEIFVELDRLSDTLCMFTWICCGDLANNIFGFWKAFVESKNFSLKLELSLAEPKRYNSPHDSNYKFQYSQYWESWFDCQRLVTPLKRSRWNLNWPRSNLLSSKHNTQILQNWERDTVLSVESS